MEDGGDLWAVSTISSLRDAMLRSAIKMQNPLPSTSTAASTWKDDSQALLAQPQGEKHENVVLYATIDIDIDTTVSTRIIYFKLVATFYLSNACLPMKDRWTWMLDQ